MYSHPSILQRHGSSIEFKRQTEPTATNSTKNSQHNKRYECLQHVGWSAYQPQPSGSLAIKAVGFRPPRQHGERCRLCEGNGEQLRRRGSEALCDAGGGDFFVMMMMMMIL